ncbi:MAG: hypothetical protein JWO38_1414 [Gemmataceae bacterium]|nr:hypothetical protein [Gemmataceae bacterium]
MRDSAPCHWQRWRVALVERTSVTPVADRFARRPLAAPDPAVGPAGCSTEPGADGIRHELVARVRREIEAGTYDTEEKWLAAEERLFRNVGWAQ